MSISRINFSSIFYFHFGFSPLRKEYTRLHKFSHFYLLSFPFNEHVEWKKEIYIYKKRIKREKEKHEETCEKIRKMCSKEERDSDKTSEVGHRLSGYFLSIISVFPRITSFRASVQLRTQDTCSGRK